jgi:KEOPS complex subunit Pcc1
LRRRAEKNSLQRQKQLPKTRKGKPQAEITIQIGLPSSRLADTIHNSLLPETRQTPRFRSRTTIGRKGAVLRLNIKADDIVALRAASNTFLRFISVAMKTLNVVSPFYRADEPNPIQRTTGKKIDRRGRTSTATTRAASETSAAATDIASRSVPEATVGDRNIGDREGTG